MEKNFPSLQALCLRKIRQSIIKRENKFAKRIHLCPVEFQDKLLSICSAKQLKIAERSSEKSRVDLDTSSYWKILCKNDFNCDKKSPDITWDIKYELLGAERKRQQEEQSRAIIERCSQIKTKEEPLAKVVKGRAIPSHPKKRTTLNKSKVFVLPSGRIYRYTGTF